MKIFNQIGREDFLKNYWQQKPLLIKNGLADFKDLISPDELAGLASEAQVESRRITFDSEQKNWQAELGPFENYDALGEENWTLVVQAVNHWVEMNDFLKDFDFIPKWRFDDVMSSFAAKGGSVGPHIDYYDVFICQGSGQRRWIVGDRDSKLKEVIPHEKLKHVEPFAPIIDEVLSAGDILYLPPGYPHEGISLSPSMSFSVGYKSTNENELISGFADFLLDYHESPRYLVDKARDDQKEQSMISNKDFFLLKDFIRQTLTDESLLADFMGRYYSEASHELDEISQALLTFDEWRLLFAKQPLFKLAGLKTLYLESSIDQGVFYINGDIQQTGFSKNIIQAICNQSQIDESLLAASTDPQRLCEFLYRQTCLGYWFFED